MKKEIIIIIIVATLAILGIAGTIFSQLSLATATNKISYQSTRVRVLISQVSEQETELNLLRRQVDCSSKPSFEFDYSSNVAISESLKEWVGEIDSKAISANWDVVWNNAKTTTHKITAKYLWVYIVFFDDTERGFTEAIFDVSGQCFLDR